MVEPLAVSLPHSVHLAICVLMLQHLTAMRSNMHWQSAAAFSLVHLTSGVEPRTLYTSSPTSDSAVRIVCSQEGGCLQATLMLKNQALKLNRDTHSNDNAGAHKLSKAFVLFLPVVTAGVSTSISPADACPELKSGLYAACARITPLCVRARLGAGRAQT